MKIHSLIKTKMLKAIFFLALELSEGVFMLLVNVKMSTIVDILTFIIRMNFMLILVEHEKCFIT